MSRITGFILFLAVLSGSEGFPAAAAVAGSVRPENAMISSVRVPFIANEGQLANPRVKYYARTFGGTVYALADGKIVYLLPKFESGKPSGAAVITEILRDAFQAGPCGAEKSGVKVSSFIGDRPEGWKSNLPVFDRLDFGEVYEGISLLLAAHGNNVEKIFVLAPGAEPGDIAFNFEGALDVAITDNGELEIRTVLGNVYFTRPVAWQIEDTARRTVATKRDPPFSVEGHALSCPSSFPMPSIPLFQAQITPVDVAYALDKEGTVRFKLGPYDRNKALVIDPLLASTFIGGGGADAVQAMVINSQTNIYVAGYTDSSDFPTNNGAYNSRTGGQDAFVSRFDGNLGALLSSTYIGGSSNDQATAIGIDNSARIWVAGYTESTNFPGAGTGFQSNYNGNGDAFLAILSSNLSTLVRATYIGGSNIDCAATMVIDKNCGRQYVAGYTESGNFPVTNLAGYATNYNGARDAFVLYFSNDVISIRGGTFLGGTNFDEAAAITITSFVYVAGSTASTNFPVTTGSYQRVHAGGTSDVFVSRLSVLLTNLASSTFLGGTGNERAYAIGYNLSNGIYVAGSVDSSGFPRTPSGNIYLTGWTNAYWGALDIFISCFTNNLTNLSFSTYLGGSGDDVAKGLAVDDSNTNHVEVYLTGYTSSSNFPNTANAYDRSYNGGNDAFAMRLDGRLTNLYASTYLGGAGNDQGLAIALSPETNLLFVAGITASSNFPTSDAACETTFREGASDGFASKFPASLSYGTVKWKKCLTNAPSVGYCSSPALTWDGKIVVGTITSLYAFTQSGIESWQLMAITSSVAEYVSGRDGRGNPAVGTNNVIYINTDSGKVWAVTSGGTNSLLFTNFEGPPSLWSAPAIGNNNQLFFTCGRYFYALNQNGACLWTNSLDTSAQTSPSISSNGTIYAVDSTPVAGAKLYAFNPDTGYTNTVWTGTNSMFSSPALNSNGLIYAATTNTLYAFYPNGGTAQTWHISVPVYSSPAIGTNGVVYIGGGNNLYILRPDNTTSRICIAGGEVRSSPAIAADGSIIFGAAGGFVYSCNADGTTNWVFETSEYSLFQSPLIDSEGTIYISDNDYVYAIYGSAPPADSPWPMFRRDALRTANQGLNITNFLRPGSPSASKYGAFTNIHVSWNASPNAISYELWRNTNNSTVGATRIKRLTQTNYIDSSIDPGKIYYYWLKVKTPIALSSFSSSDSGGIVPLSPTDVTATKGVPTNYVQITWGASLNATTYTIWRSLSNATNTAQVIATNSSTSYSDYTVEPSFHYYYWAKAANDVAGTSDFSANDFGGIPCSAPGGLSASQGDMQAITLSWSVSNVTTGMNYIVYRNTEENPNTAIPINTTTNLNAGDIITPIRHHYYWVRATNEFGLSGFSEPATGWSLLAPPASASASAGAYVNMVRVSWSAGSTDATAHVVFRGTSSDPSAATRQSEVVYSPDTATNYDDTAISRGVSYYYWVAAKNSYGSSTWTAASTPGGIAPASPSDLNATDGTSSNMVQVTWTCSPGATYYAIYRNETFNSNSASLLGITSTNYYNDSNASRGMLYYYWSKSSNSYGLSALSAFNSGWRGLTPPASITAGDTSTSEVSVTWSAAPEATAYELWRGTSSDSASASRLVNNLPDTSYSDQSAKVGTLYYYRVKAKRGSYSSVFSGYDSGFKAIGLLDIGVSDFVFVPTVFGPPAHPAAVSFRVSNLSALDMIEPNNTVQYDFYLSENAVFDRGSDRLIGSASAAISLNAGASSRVTCSANTRSSITIPAGIAGRYYVFVFANHCLPSAWLDPNLVNNTACRLGSSILIASATALQPVWNDYDGDGKTDFAVYNSATGGWRIWLSASSYAPVDLTGLGGSGYRAVPRDYDGDGKFDPAVYKEATGIWLVCFSAYDYQMITAAGLGRAGQSAVPADYDGDGKTDPAVYQSTAGGWRAWLSAYSYAEVNFSGLGGANWSAVPADYDGDAKADPAVYHEASGTWAVCLSAAGYQIVTAGNLGGAGWKAIPADYDGDGKTDPAVQAIATGGWRLWLSSASYGEVSVAGLGGAGQTAVPGDYDSDGRVDAAVYWKSLGIWRLWLSSYGYSETDVLAAGGEGFETITAEE